MGVDFFPCDACGESICDCGSYVYCNDGCGRRWCDDKCAASDGFDVPEDWDDRTCAYCRLEAATDSQLLGHLLSCYNLTREDVEKDYLASVKAENEQADDQPAAE